MVGPSVSENLDLPLVIIDDNRRKKYVIKHALTPNSQILMSDETHNAEHDLNSQIVALFPACRCVPGGAAVGRSTHPGGVGVRIHVRVRRRGTSFPHRLDAAAWTRDRWVRRVRGVGGGKTWGDKRAAQG